MENVLITGANKGIGLQLVIQHLNRGDNVIAVCRKPSTKLLESGARIVSGVDFLANNFEEILNTGVQVQNLDRVIANAGIMDFDDYAKLESNSIRRQFEVNALSPLRLIKALDSKLGVNSKIILLSTRFASIDDNTSGGDFGYRMSKAALNMAGVNLALALKHRSIGVFLMHPGYVKTDLTKGEGLIGAEESAKCLLDLADKLDLSSSGTFWHAIEKTQLPW